MMEDRFLKRLRKKARKGLRGWPIATVAFYGPNLSQATKVTVGIVPLRMQRWESCATGKWMMARSVTTPASLGRYWNLSRSAECYQSR
jgi:hypothetical protein